MKTILFLILLSTVALARTGGFSSVDIKLSEQVTTDDGLTIKFKGVGQGKVKATYIFDLSTKTKKTTMSLPLETAKEPSHTFEKYKLKVVKVSKDGKTVTLSFDH